jgi:AAA domain
MINQSGLWTPDDEDPEQLKHAVEEQARKLWINRAANELLNGLEEGRWPDDDFENAAVERAELAAAHDHTHYFIEKFIVDGARILIIAQWKVGKTCLTVDACSSLLFHRPFLGQFAVDPNFSCHIGYLNFEMTKQLWWSEYMQPYWTDEALKHFHTLHLKGFRIDMRAKVVRRRLIRWLQMHEICLLVIDTYGASLIGDDPDKTHVAREWVNSVDEIAREAGVGVVIVVTHAGLADAKRARNSTVLMDWPDQFWMYEKVQGHRWLSSYGRYDTIEKLQATFTETGELLGTFGKPPSDLSGDDLKGTAASVMKAVAAYLRQRPGATSTDVKTGIKGFTNVGKVTALSALVLDGNAHFHKPKGHGEGQTKLHFLGSANGCPVKDGELDRASLIAQHPAPPDVERIQLPHEDAGDV